MSDGVIGLLAAILVAALSGETVIAYRHPKQFKTLYVILSMALGTLFLGLATWNISNDWACMAMNEGNTALYSEYVKLRGQAASMQAPTWTFLATAAVWLYSVFLATFPNWLLEPKQNP